ncbi:glycosyl transferase [Mycobacterium tuberculosis variant bovis]|uniref:glycosyltransferase n=4 Tax=Mycobacterium tuberculosis TaxID=1773 RepID=UPI000C072963|nr:glycosyltransferase [Mycobacterium tuberculosis]PHO30201.1 glycosyl transferase [Mycobacterium tuberculosis variant bovis]PHO56436.1 glycosyl transferase [Mycobacterium tuberculosis variant bovis]
MKFVLAVHGTRGDVEPCAAVGVELRRRGHAVHMAVPPNLIEFVESAGLTGVAYGPDSDEQINTVAAFVRNLTRAQNPLNLARAVKELFVEGWAELSAMLTPVAAGADLLLTGQIYQEVVANVAEHHGIPLAALHFYPVRANGEIAFPARLPAPLVRSTITAIDWLYWRMTKGVEDAQRRELGLPKASTPAPRRMAVRGSLEIQAYDALCFPGLAAEWGGRRPFVGALTMESATDADDEVASWIAADTPPIYFGFGSMPIGSLADRVAMISAACAELGERALICSGPSDATGIPQFDHVKVVRVVSHAAVFPTCRAVVHHGGAGTTAAGLRAGMPTLILWDVADQPIWAGAVQRLKVGSAKRFTNITRGSLLKELRSILAPECAARAREISTRMTRPTAAVTAAADLLEATARQTPGSTPSSSPGR